MATRDTQLVAFIAAMFLVVIVDPALRSQSLATQINNGPKCLGVFCIDPPHRVRRLDLIKLYGLGKNVDGNLCYQDPESGLFVHFVFSGGRSPDEASRIFVSRSRNCSTFSKATRGFSSLRTREGIGIGDSYEKVLQVYGSSQSSEKGTGLDMVGGSYEEKMKTAPFGNKVLIYLPGGDKSLLGAAVYFTSGKVTAIAISFSE